MVRAPMLGKVRQINFRIKVWREASLGVIPKATRGFIVAGFVGRDQIQISLFWVLGHTTSTFKPSVDVYRSCALRHLLRTSEQWPQHVLNLRNVPIDKDAELGAVT
mmetsp:Transcript_26249/g.50299  ORF Transcript_26249/g.50299 Transcript_26249/m.50299 type:complete len:106 (-) Transcript_26249:766-1083(-)